MLCRQNIPPGCPESNYKDTAHVIYFSQEHHLASFRPSSNFPTVTVAVRVHHGWMEAEEKVCVCVCVCARLALSLSPLNGDGGNSRFGK